MGEIDQEAMSPGESAVLFNQWGGVRKNRTGRQLNGRTYDELPVQGSAVSLV
jgi:protein gp37